MVYMFKPYINFLTDHSKAVVSLILLLCFMFVSHTVWSVPCGLMITCLERADLLALYVMVSSVYASSYSVLAQIWYLVI